MCDCENCIPREQVEQVVGEIVDDRVSELKDELEEKDERIDELESELERTRARFDSRTEWHSEAISELQSRELDKDGHLKEENVVPDRLETATDNIVTFEGDDGTDYVREPGAEDPLERSGTSAVATADLLPIQQLARMDDDMLANATSTRPDYIAARVWAERGQHSRGSVWSQGSCDVREYVDASDVRLFIKSELERSDESLSYEYAKKLAGDALERLRELAKNRVYIEQRNRKKDGLQYKERRLVLPSDAEIPGEGQTEAPGTNEVAG